MIQDPSKTSSDHDAMSAYWRLSAALVGGTETMRQAGKNYLPQFTEESDSDYKRRLGNAKYTNIFGDILETLSCKPFKREIQVKGAEPLSEYIEDIDGRGNHLHAFATSVFHDGIADGITWVLVDYTKGVPQNASLAQEREFGARPYWVHIPARDVLAAYSEVVGGVETLVHVRLREDAIERDGFGEKTIERVRVLNREVDRNGRGEVVRAAMPTWELWEKQKAENLSVYEWTVIDEGVMTIDEIPLAPFITGRRKNRTWQIKPPLVDAAYLQVKHYQYESGLDYAADNTCFPMLAGNGIQPPIGEDGKPLRLAVGPKSVLYAPPSGDGSSGTWAFIEPNASSLTFISERMIKATEQQIRELGRQPLTAQSGNITTITAAFAGDKAHTVIEAWTLNFKDFLEQCLKITAKWRKLSIEPEIDINTDFDIGLREETGMTMLDQARLRGDLSLTTYWRELKRRNYLSENFDPEEEQDLLINEMPGDAIGEELDDLEDDEAPNLAAE